MHIQAFLPGFAREIKGINFANLTRTSRALAFAESKRSKFAVSSVCSGFLIAYQQCFILSVDLMFRSDLHN